MAFLRVLRGKRIVNGSSGVLNRRWHPAIDRRLLWDL